VFFCRRDMLLLLGCTTGVQPDNRRTGHCFDEFASSHGISSCLNEKSNIKIAESRLAETTSFILHFAF
jgi:hypothetical protein